MTPSDAGIRISGMTVTPSGGPPQSVILIGDATATAKSLVASVASLTFPTVPVGLSTQNDYSAGFSLGQVSLQNTGNAPVTIQSVSVTGANPSDFVIQNGSSACAYTLAPEGACYLTVWFRPTAAGMRTAALTVGSDATNGTLSVPLSGEGAAAFTQLEVPGLIDFPNVVRGNLGQAYVTLNNSGSENITVSGVRIVGANASDFSILQNPCSTVAPLLSCQVSLIFTPAATGLRVATVVIADSAPGSPHMVPIEGAEIQPVPQIQWWNTQPLNFGLPGIGTNMTMGFSILNSGNVPASPMVRVEGANAQDFDLQFNCPGVMSFDEVCPGSVTFQPTGAGERVAYLAATNSSGGQPIYLPLIGFAPNPLSALFSNGIDLGPQVIGASSEPYPFLLFNQTQSAVAITGLSVAGTAAGDFQISQNGCSGTSVPAQFSCQYDLSFTPSAVGLRSAILLVTYQGGPATLEVPILGTGSPTRSSVVFNQTSFFQFAVPVGEPVSQQVESSNTGSTSVDFSNFAITGPAASDYTVTTNSCASGISANDGCGMTVQFAPSTVGLRPAILQIYDTASGSPQNVPLLGAGSNGAPALIYNNFLNFNAETLGSSGHLTISLTGSSTGDITLSNITITGPNASDFSLINGCPTTIPAQSPTVSCNLTVTFTPSVTGSRVAQIELTDNAAGSPQIIPIGGIGLTAERSISFFPSILSFPEFQGAGYATNKTLQISSTGTAPVTFTGFQISGPAASDFSIVSNMCKVMYGGCRLTISFTPSTAGLRTASLYMADNAAQSPQSVVLAGVGFPASSSIVVSPQSLAFGSIPVGVQSTDQPFVQLVNEGTVPITIQNVSLSGSPDFSVGTDGSAATPFSLVPGGSCSFVFQFTPSSAGAKTATFTVSSSATNGPQSVTLSGTGQ